MKNLRLSGTAGLLLLIIAAGATARFWAIDFGLPNIDVRPDEDTIVSVSMALLFQGLNPKFFDYPSLEFYLLAAIYRLRWEVGHWQGYFQHKWQITGAIVGHPLPYFVASRAISATAGTVTIWLVYRLGQKIADRMTGIVAAFFLAFAFLHVRDSHFGVTDVPMTALATAAMIPLVSAFFDPETRRHWTRAGLLAGLAASTKYTGGIVAISGLVVAAIALSERRGITKGPERRVIIRHAVRFVVASVIGFLIGTPFAALDFPRFIGALSFESTHAAAGHGAIVGRGWSSHFWLSLRYGMGWPMLAGALAGMVILFAQSWKRALLLSAFPIAAFLLIGHGYTVFVRYILPIVPCLCVLAAIAVLTICRKIARVVPLNAAVLTTVMAGLVALPSIQSVIAFDRILANRDTRLLARAWIDARRQPGDWVHEEWGVQVYPDFGRPPDVHVSTFDAGRRVFLSEKGDVVAPTWVVIGASPLTGYSTPPPELLEMVTQQFVEATSFVPTTGVEAPETYDQQDKFYMPFTDFSKRLRPGPEIRIYRRR